MLKNKNVINILFVMGWLCFGIDAFLLIMVVTTGTNFILVVMYFIYAFILGCFAFMTYGLMEMAETQKKRNEIILEIAKRFDKKE